MEISERSPSIWVRSRNCSCLVTWFCYQLIAKPGNKTAAVSWPDPYIDFHRLLIMLYWIHFRKYKNISYHFSKFRWLRKLIFFLMEDEDRGRFTNGFSIAIQIRWQFRFTLTSILIQWSLQNCVHGTTAVLSWHVQKFVAILWPATELWQGEVSIEFELRAKKTLVKRAPGLSCISMAVVGMAALGARPSAAMVLT